MRRAAVLAVALAGCGGGGAGDGLVPVSGAVTVGGAPAAGVVVTFVPRGDTPGNGGHGVTDAAGRYEAVTPYLKKGLPPGAYKVTLSLRQNADGSAADPDTPPIESAAREKLPARYTDPERTDLTATVGDAGGAGFDFAVPPGKKK
jgi:hypothetical protein